jgi:hypothetical protein
MTNKLDIGGAFVGKIILLGCRNFSAVEFPLMSLTLLVN